MISFFLEYLTLYRTVKNRDYIATCLWCLFVGFAFGIIFSLWR